MSPLSSSAQRAFEYLPPHYGADESEVDPIVARWLEALGFELDRLRAIFEALRSTTIPAAADDTVGSLGRWEGALRLPVRPAGASVAQRRAKVLGTFLGRRVTTGLSWTEAITAAIGSEDWQAFEHTPSPNQLTIEIPYVGGTYNAGQVEELARSRTPANQQIVMRYEEGFIVGVSRVDLDAI